MQPNTAHYVGRFAPSPTGPLHFGSLVAALASYLDAKAHGGRWLVRMEDIDETRCHPRYAEDILTTLDAFGLHWDGDVLVQSTRKTRYAQALARLSAQGLTYACACSRREIADSAITGIDGPVYPGTCRSRQLSKSGNAIRIIAPDRIISMQDGIQGQLSQHLATDVGDFILQRRDGLFAYQLAVVVDDADQGITHVVRGADLLDSTPRQMYLATQLGFSSPYYLHIPVATNQEGQKLSKQTLAPGITVSARQEILVAALRFLNQDIRSPAVQPVSDLLRRAIEKWNVCRIPKQRACTA